MTPEQIKVRAEKREKQLAARARKIDERANPPPPRPESALGPDATQVEEVEEEVSETLRAFKNRAKGEAERFADATDSEFWCALAFDTRAHKEAFLRALNLSDLGDKYLDGHAVAERLAAVLPARLPARGHRPHSRRWTALAEED